MAIVGICLFLKEKEGEMLPILRVYIYHVLHLCESDENMSCTPYYIIICNIFGFCQESVSVLNKTANFDHFKWNEGTKSHYINAYRAPVEWCTFTLYVIMLSSHHFIDLMCDYSFQMLYSCWRNACSCVVCVCVRLPSLRSACFRSKCL